MATASKDLSSKVYKLVPDASDMKFAVIVAEWNAQITDKLFEGAKKTLLKFEAKEENINVIHVPGSFELSAGARLFAEDKNIDAIICLGCVIQGETRHFDFICNAVSVGLTQLTVNFNKPFIFGVLTTDNLEQALDRAGGKHGNKGEEAAVTAIKMVQLTRKYK
ncbi:MAG: 6,7-dimethyl-8-ribityllumazine synthase [Bacteroidia bacterium]